MEQNRYYYQEMKSEKVSETITRVTFDSGKEIILVGTAHVSGESVNEVKTVIETENPDRICLELDQGRWNSITSGARYKETDIAGIIKEGKGFLFLANLVLASFQKKLGTQTGSAPGMEIVGAGQLAIEKGIPYSLCDREISVTLKRAWAKSDVKNRCKLIGALISAAFDKEELSPEDLEKLKQQDVMQSMMEDLAKELPAAKEVLIDERDRYLASSIYQAEGNKLVAVIGAGHAPGIVKTFEKLEKEEISTDVSDINFVPPSRKSSKIFQWIIPAAIIAVVVVLGVRKGWDQGLRAFGLWALANSGSTLISAIISGAHPLNWLVAAVTAPFAALNPVVGVGIFTGVTEAKLRKPRVVDFENLTTDTESFKGWFRNRVLHALVVFFATSIGSIIGTFVIFPILM